MKEALKELNPEIIAYVYGWNGIQPELMKQISDTLKLNLQSHRENVILYPCSELDKP